MHVERSFLAWLANHTNDLLLDLQGHMYHMSLKDIPCVLEIKCISQEHCSANISEMTFFKSQKYLRFKYKIKDFVYEFEFLPLKPMT